MIEDSNVGAMNLSRVQEPHKSVLLRGEKTAGNDWVNYGWSFPWLRCMRCGILGT